MKPAIVALVFYTVAASGQTPPSTASTMTRDGPALYRLYCASCHGMSANGDGPVSAALKTPPPDLTRISIRNGGQFPQEMIVRIIRGDAGVKTAHGNRDMPVWGPVFSQVENDQDAGPVRVDNLARYLRRIQKR